MQDVLFDKRKASAGTKPFYVFHRIPAKQLA